MPCWETVRVSVELRAENFDLLKRALEADEDVSRIADTARGVRFHQRGVGYVEVEKRGAKLVATGYDIDGNDANALNRLYSRQVIREAASRQGFTLREKGPNRLVAVKALGGSLVALLFLSLATEASAHHEEIVAAAPFFGAWSAYVLAALGGTLVAVRRLVRKEIFR